MKVTSALLALVLGVSACAQSTPVVSQGTPGGSPPPSKTPPAQGPVAQSPITVTIPLPFWAGGDRVYEFADWEAVLRFASDKYTEYLIAGDSETSDAIMKFIQEKVMPAKEASANQGNG